MRWSVCSVFITAIQPETIFLSQKGTPPPTGGHPLLLLPLSPDTTDLLCLWICLFRTFHRSGIRKRLSFAAGFSTERKISGACPCCRFNQYFILSLLNSFPPYGSTTFRLSVHLLRAIWGVSISVSSPEGMGIDFRERGMRGGREKHQ